MRRFYSRGVSTWQHFGYVIFRCEFLGYIFCNIICNIPRNARTYKCREHIKLHNQIVTKKVLNAFGCDLTSCLYICFVLLISFVRNLYYHENHSRRIEYRLCNTHAGNTRAPLLAFPLGYYQIPICSHSNAMKEGGQQIFYWLAAEND